MKKYAVKNFTLIELLAAMAVFSILLMLSIRLFTGSQQIWLRSEQKTDTFASARTVMEYMASRIQALSYVEEKDEDKWYPFEKKDDSIWFISTMAAADGSSKFHFLKFRLVPPNGTSDYAGHLQMIKYHGHQKRAFFGQLFPTYYEEDDSSRIDRTITSYEEAMDHLKAVFNYFDDSNGYLKNGNDNPKITSKILKDDLNPNSNATITVETKAEAIDVCENVIGLKFKYYVVDDNGELAEAVRKSNGEYECPNSAPYLVEIELKMLDSRDSFLKWQRAANNTEQNRIFLENGYTFSRAVLLGKKGK